MIEDAKRLYPAFVDLEGRLCVVIGDGPSAEKRARQLTRYGADVVAINPHPSDELVAAEADGLLTIETRAYVRGDLTGARLALCVVEDEEVWRAVHDEAETIGCLVNVTGAPEGSDFLVPSVVHREPLQVAISTGGRAPEVAKALRREITALVGQGWGEWLELVASVRARALAEPVATEALGRRALEIAAQPEVRERLAVGEAVTADAIFVQARDELEAAATSPGLAAELPEAAGAPEAAPAGEEPA